MTVTKRNLSSKSESNAKQEQQSSKNSTQPKDKQETDSNISRNVTPLGKVSQHRILSRMVVIAGLLVYVWYTSRDGKETVLAKQKEVLPKRGQSFGCDEEYMKEIEGFHGCAPQKCGRYVSDKIVTANEAETLLKIAKKGIALGGSDGGASILDLHSGALSYGEKFINVYSVEEAKKVFNPSDLAIYRVIKSKIQHAIAETFQISHDSLYLTHPTFFSKLTNLDPKTEHDEYWHAHIDKVTYESFHYTSLLYLSDYGVDFEGGRLVWLDGPISKPHNNVTLEPRKGRVAMFTSGAENVHYVERVAKGVRYAITVSFTCDTTKSIKDPVAS